MANHDRREGLLSSSPSHRLPTVSASQALQSIHSRGARAVSTGLAQLNRILAPQGLPGHSIPGGLLRGKVTEVYGPSGVGKTAFGIQAAVNALCEGHGVVWVDAAAPLVPQRFNDVLVAATDPQGPGTTMSSPSDQRRAEMKSHFHHFASPTLAHLLALFVHPPAAFPPPNTSLVVINSLSTLLDNAYPRNADDRGSRTKSEPARWAAGRKFAVMNELISTLARVAALHDIALLLTCQTITRIRGGSRALLVPAISGAEWENGVSTRLVLFRDWIPAQGKSTDTDADRLQKARFVGVVKANGVTLAEERSVGNVVPFAIDSTGLCDINIATVDIAAPMAPTPQTSLSKRRFAEIGDSEEDADPDSDELYGWIEDDQVAAEGLLVVEQSDDINTAESRTDRVPEERSKKVARFATC
ncbi:P-loop containing nucleoside triphosphate hydrolase protein [Amniculicola lignicola CBS 123094]|uniref:P-loop containing nucleoside triphosphate hydrolase protein n=1 Tax=Amniculicola lignicola CBS 123094 TaxID=1392246 RepID=A0A6A5W0Y2_9PLEO|nr:P-loop containing nucleoside triphosphate hydrolase protein [Amniculicola lignicola CBS 123094]